AIILVSSSMAEDWKRYVFQARSDIKTDGTLNPTKLVDFWVNQDGYESRFTIYKPNVNGLRVYIVFEGISWQAFQQYTLFAATAIKSIDMPDGTKVPFGFLNMTDAALTAGGITVKAGMSGEFLKLYHHQPRMSVRVIGQSMQTIGNAPNVTVDLKGGKINVVKVDYPRPAVSKFATPGIVKVKQSGKGRESYISAVNVRGGKLGDCTAVHGINQLTVKGRRYKKTTIIGGNTTGTTKTDGKIDKIFVSNGLGGTITSGDDKSANGIRKVVCVRGGNGAKIIAGGDQVTPIGAVGKISISTKKHGANTTLANCNFYSYSVSKVRLNKKHTTFAEVVNCKVITPNGPFPIDATYKNLK
ncbi:hypothetical protein KAH27_05315, partial [bacterium]|nr:hypothetical protein [bacterium]